LLLLLLAYYYYFGIDEHRNDDFATVSLW
jgi:hypothetical protein